MEHLQTGYLPQAQFPFPIGFLPAWPIYEDDPAAEFEPIPSLSAAFVEPGQKVSSYHG